MTRQIIAMDILAGCAVGDSIGWPFEFDTEYEIRERCDTTNMFQYVREYTDDTQMTLATTRIIPNLTGVTPYSQEAQDVMWVAYQDWMLTQNMPGQSRAPGLTVMRSLRGARPGTMEDRLNDSKGNGTVMRCGLYGMMNNEYDAVNFAVQDALLTHSHIAAPIASALHAAMNWFLINTGYSFHVCLREAIRVTADVFNNVRFERYLNPGNAAVYDQLIQEATNLAYPNSAEYPQNPEDYRQYLFDNFGRGTADTTILLALYALLEGWDFHRAMVYLVVNNGDSDTYAAVYGSMYGAGVRRNMPDEGYIVDRTDDGVLFYVTRLSEYPDLLAGVHRFPNV